MHSFTHSLFFYIHSSTYLYIHSFILLSIHPPIHSLFYSSIVYLFIVRPFIHLFIHPSIHPSVHLVIHLFNHSFIHPFIHHHHRNRDSLKSWMNHCVNWRTRSMYHWVNCYDFNYLELFYRLLVKDKCSVCDQTPKTNKIQLQPLYLASMRNV